MEEKAKQNLGFCKQRITGNSVAFSKVEIWELASDGSEDSVAKADERPLS